MVNLWLRWFNYGKHAFFGFICGYGGLTMVNMLFLVLFVVTVV